MTLLDRRPAAVTLPSRAAHATSALEEPLRAVLLVLPFVVIAEVVLMRTFYRVGIFIPKDGAFRTAYSTLSDIGSFAFNLASVAALVALGLLAVLAVRHGNAPLGIAISAFALSVVVARIAGVVAIGPIPRLASVLALLAVTLPFLRSEADPAHRILVGIVAACLALSAYTGVAQGAGVEGAPGVTGGPIAAELLVMAAAAISPLVWVRTDRFRIRPLVVATPLAASFVVAWSANAAVTGILALWTVGLRLYLSPWIYAVALWAFLTLTLGWLQRWPWRSAGLVLLVAGGMLSGSTYQLCLGILALVMLTDGVAFGGLPLTRRHSAAALRLQPAQP